MTSIRSFIKGALSRLPSKSRLRDGWRCRRARLVTSAMAMLFVLAGPSRADAASVPSSSQAWIPTTLLLSIAFLVGFIAAIINAWAARADGKSWPCTITRAGSALAVGMGVMLAIFTFLGLAL
ncbi:hypothetical protein GCM10010234_50880 [Streptomyces hawaiiensis]|uniref:hypothetical protein n=1 Tax=Streptomyces hawaiiensis TaxID=67305 RepID=UPI0031CFDA21